MCVDAKKRDEDQALKEGRGRIVVEESSQGPHMSLALIKQAMVVGQPKTGILEPVSGSLGG
jgi:hypothetical protein